MLQNLAEKFFILGHFLSLEVIWKKLCRSSHSSKLQNSVNLNPVVNLQITGLEAVDKCKYLQA